MGQKISPVTAAVIIIVVIAVAAAAWFTIESRSGAGSKAGEKPPGMPDFVAAEFQRRQGKITGPPPGSENPPGPTLPPGGTGTMPTPPPPTGGQ